MTDAQTVPQLNINMPTAQYETLSDADKTTVLKAAKIALAIQITNAQANVTRLQANSANIDATIAALGTSS